MRFDLSIFVVLATFPVAMAAEEISFNRDIRPILSDRCYFCHGFDSNHRQADLRLDVREDAEYTWDTDSPDDSELLRRIVSTDPDEVMPPPDAHKTPITDDEVRMIRRWIQQGAEYEPHWAFLPPARPNQPATQPPSIDFFVQRQLADKGIELLDGAHPMQLLRRVSLDLIGLPPIADQMRQFERAFASNPEQAYQDAVDRLLASPQFGERMAIDWMDVARYADTNGFQQDQTRTNWPWRDWVIQAFNRNMPFDQFTIEQLAGDLLVGKDGTGPSNEQLVATAFNRNHMINGEGGAIVEENLAKYAFDRTETTATTWLGLTVGCAQCHDHKFDPITQRDYYRLMAMFNQMDEPGALSKRWESNPSDKKNNERFGVAKPFISVGSDTELARLAELRQDIADAKKTLREQQAEYTPAFVQWVTEMRNDETLVPQRLKNDYLHRFVNTIPLTNLDDRNTKRLVDAFLETDSRWKSLDDAVKKAIADEGIAQSQLPVVMIMRDDRPRDTFILERGNYETPGDKVSPGVPSFLPQLSPDVKADRLALARWIVSSENPLTARVIVNRYWQLLFGRALVETADDFGLQGSLPTHPELLDWLAAEFVDSGWDVKQLLKTIVSSKTYRQTSHVAAQRIAIDPENKWYARGPRHRLDSRLIRDSALAISGLLNPEMGGPPVKPYQPPGIWEEMSLYKNFYQQASGGDLYRRSVYTFWRRVVGPTHFFDVPARQTCSVRVYRTSTPMHALTLLNDTTYVEAARVWAADVLARIRDGRLTDGSDAFRHVFLTATARQPSHDEVDLLQGSLADAKSRFAQNRERAQRLLATGEAPTHEDQTIEHAAWTSLCLLVLNLDEAISKP